MKQPKPRVYLETSVISYHTARLHRDPLIRSRQLTTRRWWEAFRGKVDFYVPTYVLKECAAGDSEAARKRLEFLDKSAKTVSNRDSDRLGGRLFHDLGVPERSRMDAWHLAMAALSRQDYIVSWNFRHMANGRVRASYERACVHEGLSYPTILTPGQMLEREEP